MIADTSQPSKSSEFFPKKAREWFYDSINQELTTNVEGVKTSLSILGQPRNWASVQIVSSNTLVGTQNGKWRIEYCFKNK